MGLFTSSCVDCVSDDEEESPLSFTTTGTFSSLHNAWESNLELDSPCLLLHTTVVHTAHIQKT